MIVLVSNGSSYQSGIGRCWSLLQEHPRPWTFRPRAHCPILACGEDDKMKMIISLPCLSARGILHCLVCLPSLTPRALQRYFLSQLGPIVSLLTPITLLFLHFETEECFALTASDRELLSLVQIRIGQNKCRPVWASLRVGNWATEERKVLGQYMW